MKHKCSPGVCGLCGRAVRRPTPNEMEQARRYAQRFDRSTIEANGHTYAIDDEKLMSVRCRDHESKERD
jgi:hypothetical protein